VKYLTQNLLTINILNCKYLIFFINIINKYNYLIQCFNIKYKEVACSLLNVDFYNQEKRLTRKIFRLILSTPTTIKSMNDISNFDIK